MQANRRHQTKLGWLMSPAGARDGNMRGLSHAPRSMNIWEPLGLLSALVATTKRIGLCGTMSTSYFEPYNLARQSASLVHLSNGRVGWNVVTSAHPAGGYNFGRGRLEDHALHCERAREFVEFCFGLWDSWDDDAFVLEGQHRDHLGLPRPASRYASATDLAAE